VQTRVGNFLPLTGGRLSGNLALDSNNIEFSTGNISSHGDLSFLINGEAKLVIREHGIDACNKKLVNVGLPTVATDGASKSYVDSEVQTHVGNFLPLTGGRLSGNLDIGSNTIEFSIGNISSHGDLSFLINREAKLVIRENGLDACNKKLINVALPTEASGAASKSYVDAEVQHVQATGRERLQLVIDSCANSAILARDSQQASERHANVAKSHADRAVGSTGAAPENPQRDKTYLFTFRNSEKTWINADTWMNQLFRVDVLTPGARNWFAFDTTSNTFQWIPYQYYRETVELERTELQSHVHIRLKEFTTNDVFGYDVYTEFSNNTVEKLLLQPWVSVWVQNNVLYMKLQQHFPTTFTGKLFIHYIRCHCT